MLIEILSPSTTFPEPTTPSTGGAANKSTPAKSKSTSSNSKAARPRPSSPASSPVAAADEGTDNNNSTAVAKQSAAPRSKRKRRAAATSSSAVAQTYTHTVDRTTIIWLLISLPLVLWDIGYVALRPHSMPGGALHSPIWTPYALYGEVDHVYGFVAWNNGVGFTAAQTALNVVETLMYAFYLYTLVTRGLNEYFSNFENIGHNSASTIIWLWVVPNGAWLILPSWMIYVFGTEIVNAMNEAGSS
ncbi:hypothetical protein DV738_g5353, partial [Chaetothyriales sp. CBS 135597]